MYLFLSQKVHVSKILFHPKIPPINMAMHPLFAVQPRGQGGQNRGWGGHPNWWPPPTAASGHHSPSSTPKR